MGHLADLNVAVTVALVGKLNSETATPVLVSCSFCGLTDEDVKDCLTFLNPNSVKSETLQWFR